MGLKISDLYLTMMKSHMATGKRKQVAEVMVIALSLLLSWFWQQGMARINIRVSHNAQRKKAES